jgi:hypothetical protein
MSKLISSLHAVALTLSAFMDFCLNYGIVAEDASDDIFSTASERRFNASTRLSYSGPQSRKVMGDDLSPRKRKNRSSSSSGFVDLDDRWAERPKRAAARGINYAED